MNENFEAMRSSLKLDKSKKSYKEEAEVPIVFLGKLTKMTNIEQDKKATMSLTVSADQFAVLEKLCMSTFKKAYSDLGEPNYLPFDSEHVILKATVS